MWSRERIRVVAVLAGANERATLTDLAARGNWSLYLPHDCSAALESVRHSEAVVLFDRDLPQCEWRAALRLLQASAPSCRIILVTPAFEDKLWLEVLERGGFDVVTRPFHERRLTDTVARAWREIRK